MKQITIDQFISELEAHILQFNANIYDYQLHIESGIDYSKSNRDLRQYVFVEIELPMFGKNFLLQGFKYFSPPETRAHRVVGIEIDKEGLKEYLGGRNLEQVIENGIIETIYIKPKIELYKPKKP